MVTVKSLSSWVDKVKDINTKATYRALNKSVAKTNTQFKRLLQKDLGMKSKDISKRIYQKKANSKSLTAYVSFGTRYGVGLHHFKPRVKVVKIGKGRKAKKYNGVSISIPAEGGRFVVPKSFMATMPNGKSLVVARTARNRYPLQVQTKDVSEIGMKHQATLTKFMREDFRQQFSAQLKVLT